MKNPKSRQRRIKGKLKRLTDDDRRRKREHDQRTGRYERVFNKKKVVPHGG